MASDPGGVHVGLSYLCGKRKEGFTFIFFKDYFCQFILLFYLFLLLFIDFIIFFDTIYESHYTISVNFYFYIKYYKKKILIFTK